MENHEKIADVEIADSFKSRLVGLMFKRKINYPLLLEIPQKFNSPSRSAIHTCFMFIPIVVAFVDENDEVFEISKLEPWKYHKPEKPAKYIIEFSEEDYFKCKLEIGNRIELK